MENLLLTFFLVVLVFLLKVINDLLVFTFYVDAVLLKLIKKQDGRS